LVLFKAVVCVVYVQLRTICLFLDMISNVIAVYRVQCSDVDRVDTDPYFDFGPELNTIVPAKLSINNKVVDKNVLWEYKLDFRSCQDLQIDGHWAYVLKLANGKWLTLGTKDRPYPVTVSSKLFPDNLSDSQLWEVSVSWSNKAQAPEF